MAEPAITLRPRTDADSDFLLSLYATTRAEELERVDWTRAQIEAFVRQQFRAQHAQWLDHYPDTSWDIIVLDGQPAGRLYVARWPGEIRIVDITLVPAHRGAGIGGRLIRQVFEEADAAGLPVSIHVEAYNPARRLYDRLGFARVGEVGVYVRMERLPRVT